MGLAGDFKKSKKSNNVSCLYDCKFMLCFDACQFYLPLVSVNDGNIPDVIISHHQYRCDLSGWQPLKTIRDFHRGRGAVPWGKII